jgi:hypothetical protein
MTPDYHPDAPQVPVSVIRTGQGFTAFSVDAAALREALDGTATTITFTAPDGWHFGADRRLHPDEDQQQRQAREIHGIYGRTLEDPGEDGLQGPPP